MICYPCRVPHEGKPNMCPDCTCQHKAHAEYVTTYEDDAVEDAPTES